MHRILLLPLLSLTTIIPAFSQQVTTIPGWTIQANNAAFVAAEQINKESSNSVVYQIRKEQSIDRPIKDWFPSFVTADIKAQQLTEPGKGSMTETNGIYVYVSEVKNAADKHWYLLYMGYEFGDRQVRLARVQSSFDKDFFQVHGLEASTHFGKFASQEMKSKPATAKSPSTPEVKQTKPVDDGLTAISAIGHGVPTSDIHSVIMHLEYEVGVGGGIYPVYNAYILFKNGTIYKYPELSPIDLNVAASKQKEPRKWGSWKLSSGTLATYWPVEKPKDQNETWDSKSYYKVSGAKKGESLEGIFKTISGGGNTALGGDVMVVTAANIRFDKQGRFTVNRVAAVSSSRDIWENTNGKSDDAGTYSLDEYCIEFKYNNGKTERRFFFFYPDSKEHFGIGQSIYMPKR